MGEQQKRKGKIIVLIGLPASGKSTYARELMEDGNLMRVNRDEIRGMLFKRWKGKKEQVVSEIEKAAVLSVVSSGFDIVIDDTNLSPNTRGRWKSLALELGVALVEKNLDTTIEVCIERDSLRTGKAHVGRGVIENMALRYNLIPPVPADQKVVIFDIDGTLADCSHRQHFIAGPGKKDHKSFYDKVSGDTPIDTVIQWCQRCYYGGYYVIIVSGRPTNLAGDATVEWLRRQGVIYQRIFMREDSDFRDDTIIKSEILEKILKWIPKEQILFSVDDRPRVISGCWRANGIKCFDVGYGVNF